MPIVCPDARKCRRTVESVRRMDGKPPEPLRLIDRMREAAATWGFLIGARYGEPFACREPVGLEGFGGLK